MPTLLCIDDNEGGLAVRKLFLESIGYSVLTATDGPAGLALMKENRVDGLILDFYMSGMDGGEVARIVRRDYPGVPIVILSGYPELPSELADLVDAIILKGRPPQEMIAALHCLGLAAAKPPAPASIDGYLERGQQVHEDTAGFLKRQRRKRR